MTALATNVGTGNYVPPAALAARGYRLVRLVSRRERADGGGPLADYVADCWLYGVAVLAVITPESAGYLCPADAYQLQSESGVEPDIEGVPPHLLVETWRIWYGTYFAPGCPLAAVPLFAPGLGSGDVGYWQDVVAWGGLPGAAALDIHPYGKSPRDAAALLARYRRVVPALPLCVLEWERPGAQIPEMLALLRRETVLSAWFSEDALPDFPAPPRLFRACAG